MKEFVTEAIVMSLEHSGEWDANATLFTKKEGRVSARVVGGKRALSKFAQHLNPLSIVLARFVQKNAITLTDVITKTRFNGTAKSMQKSLAALSVMRAVIPAKNPDSRMWFYVSVAAQKGEIDQREVLKILGHDTSRASCRKCKSREIKFFLPEDQVFLCDACGGKIIVNKVRLL